MLSPHHQFDYSFTYEGRAKSSVTNRLPLFYPKYILKAIAIDSRLSPAKVLSAVNFRWGQPG